MDKSNGLKQSILNAYDKLDPREALDEISWIWEQLDRNCELAAARSHILLSKIGKPELADEPSWFHKQSFNLFGGKTHSNPETVKNANWLVRVVSTLNAKFEAELSAGFCERVIVDWVIPDLRLQWVIGTIELPWPSVKVYELSRSNKSSRKAKTRIFHNAFEVLDSFKKHVEELNL